MKKPLSLISLVILAGLFYSNTEAIKPIAETPERRQQKRWCETLGRDCSWAQGRCACDPCDASKGCRWVQTSDGGYCECKKIHPAQRPQREIQKQITDCREMGCDPKVDRQGKVICNCP